MARQRRSISFLALGSLTAVMLTALPADGASALTRVSSASPFAGCAIQPLPEEVNYLNAEVEPWVATNPRKPTNLIGVWQQDRWQFGGSRGLMTGVSRNGGESWTRTFAHFSRCAGGNAANNGNYERASDPWVTISPNGVAHQIALSFNFIDDLNQAVLVSRSTNEGRTWSEPIALIADTDLTVADDKESITADPTNSRFVYAVWDRLVFTDATQSILERGPTLFARTTNGGDSWETARVIYDPGIDTQTLANQIVVLPNGDLVNLLVRFLHANENSPAPEDITLVVVRSHDRGLTWSGPTVINTLQTIGITDPANGDPVRTGDVIPNIAVDRESGALYVVWQDARFSGGRRDAIAFSTSRDGGLTWSAPRRINKAPRVQAFTASIDVSDGDIAVTYHDFRHDTPNPTVLQTDYWRLISKNHGATWRESHAAGPFDMRTAPFASGFFVGDYQGLSHTREAFFPFFVMANSGHLNNRTDVFAATSERERANEGNLDESEGAAVTADDTTVAPDASRPRSARDLVRSHRRGRS
jgi:hypothetical protein